MRALAFVDFEDACVFRLMEEGSVVMTVAVQVDGIIAVGEKERCDQCGRD